MSGILYREFKESPQRTVVFLTVLPPKEWRWIVSRFLEAGSSRKVNDIDISRDTSSGLTCHEVTLTLPIDGRNLDQLLTFIFGNQFLNLYLPITEKSKMGNTGGVFVRMGSVANPKGPPSSDEEYALYSILAKRGPQRGQRNAECLNEFTKDAIIEQIGSGIASDVDAVRTQAKKHGIEGGSWLLYPRDRTKDQKPIKAGEKINLLKRACDKVVRAFLEGSLLESEVSLVSFTPMKGVVKVFNPKSSYFEESARSPRPELKEIYASDIQVNQIYMKLSRLGLASIRMKYKPDIFTVWKLHANDAPGGILTLYQDLPHALKMKIAQNCVSPTPPEATMTVASVPTPSLTPVVT